MALDQERYMPIPPRRFPTSRTGSIAVQCSIFLVAALVLASCGVSTTASSSAPVEGVPTFGISVALQKVACTLNDSCVAIGASSASLGPTSVGEYRQASGRWALLTVPAVSSAQIMSSSCSSSDCLIGGAQSTGDLVWDYNASTHTVTNVVAPPGGVGVSAIDCLDPLSCVVGDVGFNGLPRIFATIDGGTTWTTPTPVTWAAGATIRTIACESATNCLASSTSTNGQVRLEVTFDAGVTWTKRSTPSSWTALSSIGCRARNCVALASAAAGSRIVRTNSFGRTWKATELTVSATALACTTTEKCLAVGQASSSASVLEQIVGGAVSLRKLRYVPSALLDVACGHTVCAAIAATTLLALKP